MSQLSALYRSLVWEGFIVLAMASENEKKDATTLDPAPLEPPSGKTTPKKDQPTLSQATPTNQEPQKTETLGDSTPFLPSLKPYMPLLAVTSRVGRSLAELMSLLVRLCTGPLHRPSRRGPGMVNNYHPPSEEAVKVCTRLTDMLVESLQWEVPIPSDDIIIVDKDMKEWLFSG